MKLNADQKNEVFSLVKQTILYGLSGEPPLEVTSDDEALNQPGACFVTLTLNKQLRGCIGSLQAHEPLIQDIANNAFKAAFQDPRFPPLTEDESEELDIEISILTTPEPMMGCESKQALLEQLVPFEDGLVLSDERHRATYLPSVWKQLPDKEAFVDSLMLKAGMSHWSGTMQCERYYVEAYEAFWSDIE
ncbi:AmmeMemoRadiSam system protein A [Hydrogenovibrio kuenenii]|uniref:AmmeMemoRadiSam system protein A n=1 Tax=Hydrogenovibrio kuenenii TaxID=63658 RepID=UPI000466C7B4|nr:AmmeMemoRadiSam system protein A [Hydrogenovibrio kuenenii]